jgi:hypothetical protein
MKPRRQNEQEDLLKTKELIEYLQDLPEGSQVQILVIDTHQERKYGFRIDRWGMVTDEEYPVIFLDIDREKCEDITKEADESEGDAG